MHSEPHPERGLPELSFLGFDSFFLNQLSRWPVPPLVPARIAGADRDRFDLWAAAGRGSARLAGAVRRRLADEALPGVGDWVVADAPARGDVVVIRGVLDRRSVFTRGGAGRQARVQVVAANVDRVFVVLGLDAGPNPHGMDRYLARVWAGGAEPRVVLNKADL
ncbi:MAG TPA: GTPase RsgA, partial [Longimicrobiales bacterium]|nr:GTPase RsgA [Longimicrobiales bacterium]